MMLLEGLVRVEYEGSIPEELEDYLRMTPGVRVVLRHPLVLSTERPEVVVNEAMPFFSSARMATKRIQVRPARDREVYPLHISCQHQVAATSSSRQSKVAATDECAC